MRPVNALFSGTSTAPANITAWINQQARYTVVQMGEADEADGRVKAMNNYFASQAGQVGYAFTKAVERLQTNGFGHHKLTRRDKFYGLIPAAASSVGGTRSTGIDPVPADPRSPMYEMIVTIIDERPDWYPNVSSSYELAPWWKKDHMFSGAHWDTATNGFITDVEALGFKGRVFFDMEIIWKRRDSRQRVNSGNYWPYNVGEGGNAAVEYVVNSTTSAKTTGAAPGPNPIPELTTADNTLFPE
jgi:hypothetical protein